MYRLVTGEYECAERRLIERHLDPTTNVIELGGGMGVIACHANRILDDPCRHIVLEANSNLIPILQRNRDMNGCSFEIINSAYHPSRNTLSFSAPSSFESGRVLEEVQSGNSIDAISLGRLLEMYELRPFSLVADIEGMEFQLIEEELDTLVDSCEAMMIEFHPTPKRPLAAVEDQLRASGFELVDQSDDVKVFKKST